MYNKDVNSVFSKNGALVRRACSYFMRCMVFILFCACGVSGCDDHSSKSEETKKECDASLKPVSADHCDCKDGSWDCSQEMVCTCDDGSACPEGNQENCEKVDPCTCDDGSVCPEGNQENCDKVDPCTCDDESGRAAGREREWVSVVAGS